MPICIAHKSKSRGFTLVEMLVTLTIIGIAASIVVPSLSSSSSFVLQAATRSIMSDILNTQNEAVAHQATRMITFDVDNNSYKLTDGSGDLLTNSWKGTDASNYVVNLSADSTYQGVKLVKVDFGGGDTSLSFDDLGSPSSGGTVDLEYSQWKYQITVAPFTGRVTVKRVDAFN